MDALGLLRIRVKRGINLSVRDTATSDPYVVVTCGEQRVKTKAVKDSCNPEWDDELTIYIKSLDVPIILCVYDKDTFTGDDSMGDAQIDIKPYVECLKMGSQDLPDNTKVDRVLPSQENCLAHESCVVWNKGKMTQEMTLRLRNAECGEVEIEIEWIDAQGCKGLHRPTSLSM
ncbi:protein C2-DOMAIN ABA-RELATED 7-like [Primulina eburnea]|uniref:protein C2-DOMAIN ABA-RELATED 7-like n=1 Tax=Primulina eburnea TaxID=1245227 RepID=UPI003C6C73BD